MKEKNLMEINPKINYLIKTNIEELEPEILKKSYIEIVHTDREHVIDWQQDHSHNSQAPGIGKAILSLEEDGYELHFYPKGDPKNNLPDISKNTPIILGGGIMEECVHLRALAYKAVGFKDVFVVKDISLIAVYNLNNKSDK